jgi:hypothetical protein
MRECSEQEIGDEVFSRFAPCWITVQDRPTMDLADKYGVNRFQYPAAMVLDTDSGKFVLWRPSKNTDELLRQIKDHAAEFEK